VRSSFTIAVLLGAMFLAAGAQAQTNQSSGGSQTPATSTASDSNAWRDLGYISGNAGWQTAGSSFTDARTLPTPMGDSESRHLKASYSVKVGPIFDVGAAFRLVKNLGVGVAVTRFSVDDDVQISGTVPHPFFFNQPRSLTGTASGTREELAIHIDAVYVIPGKQLQIAIFGGPTFFNAKQTIITDFTYNNDVYPFDNPPTFAAGVGSEESKSVVGFNIGADVCYYFTKTIGVGGIIRFSRGTLASSIGNLDLGGPQFSGGVRIRIPRRQPSAKKPSPPPPPPKKK
jgi:hypothetical protein